jgi:hypothetical protein
MLFLSAGCLMEEPRWYSRRLHRRHKLFWRYNNQHDPNPTFQIVVDQEFRILPLNQANELLASFKFTLLMELQQDLWSVFKIFWGNMYVI